MEGWSQRETRQRVSQGLPQYWSIAVHFCCTMQPHFPPQRPSSPSLHPLCNTDLCISHLLLSLTSIKSRNLPLWLLQCLMGSAADTALFECPNGNLTSFVPSMYHPVIVMNRNLNALGRLRGDSVGIPAQGAILSPGSIFDT